MTDMPQPDPWPQSEMLQKPLRLAALRFLAIRLMVAVVVYGPLGLAQSPSQPELAFDVASVKPNKSGDASSGTAFSHGGAITAKKPLSRASFWRPFV
jgi:hypothetical protein